MAETGSATDDRSLIETFRWLLFEQFDNTTADTLRQGFVFIGLATSFLAFVGATSAILESPQLYWVTLGLLVLGVATLVFSWMLIQDQLDLFGSSDPESAVVDGSEESDNGSDDGDAGTSTVGETTTAESGSHDQDEEPEMDV